MNFISISQSYQLQPTFFSLCRSSGQPFSSFFYSTRPSKKNAHIDNFAQSAILARQPVHREIFVASSFSNDTKAHIFFVEISGLEKDKENFQCDVATRSYVLLYLLIKIKETSVNQ